jgi:cell pole-organizing protein PopZ
MSEASRELTLGEILASIERVIGDNDPAEPGATPEYEAYQEGLELTDPFRSSGGLMSAAATQASRRSLAELSSLRAPTATFAVSHAPLEELVREMLKPLIKERLDQCLPEMIEELVVRAILRITSRPI